MAYVDPNTPPDAPYGTYPRRRGWPVFALGAAFFIWFAFLVWLAVRQVAR